MPNPTVLICGVSTRAAAASAAAAGYAVTAIDAFADVDQHPSVRAIAVPCQQQQTFSPRAAARLGATIDADAVAYLSSFENHPDDVVRLVGGRALWGNPPEVLRRVRDPFVLADVLRRRGLEPPLVDRVDATPSGGSWLIKPRASGGGRRIVRWDHRTIDLDHGQWYLQQEIAGTPGSIVFVAAQGRAVPLALTVQIVGDAAFGASGFTYCGNIFDVHASPALVSSAAQLAQIVAEEFELVGVNGIDFIARDDRACALEVNPRWCASMELVEMACHVSVFAAHAAACTTGALPPEPLPPRRTHGKAIVYSPHAATVSNTDEWSARGWIRDIPHSGERVAAGAPVCTVFADGRNVTECRARLAERAAWIHHTLGYDASCPT